MTLGLSNRWQLLQWRHYSRSRGKISWRPNPWQCERQQDDSHNWDRISERHSWVGKIHDGRHLLLSVGLPQLEQGTLTVWVRLGLLELTAYVLLPLVELAVWRFSVPLDGAFFCVATLAMVA